MAPILHAALRAVPARALRNCNKCHDNDVQVIVSLKAIPTSTTSACKAPPKMTVGNRKRGFIFVGFYF